jgi:phytoene dehydrogenase-like protein
VRYDAAIIGAGAEGLAAAALLAASGARTIVLERSERAGGRATTREFHPGFRASPFADELPPIPADVFWALDLARRGAIFRPAPEPPAIRKFLKDAERRAAETRARAEMDRAAQRGLLSRLGYSRPDTPVPWPSEDWMAASLADVLARKDPDIAARLAASALAGSVADPFLPGSALHLLTLGRSGIVSGGLGTLAYALVAAARAAGAEISLGLDATDIRHTNGRVTAVGLADGSEIAAGAVISTLDLKRTFLAFFQWNGLPKEIVQATGAFRMAGATARVLIALDTLVPTPGSGAMEASLDELADANAAWRAGTIASHLPVRLRVVSAADPSLAPAGESVVTATLGAVPYRLFDGAWTREKREVLRKQALAALEIAMPGASAHVIAAVVIAPPDIEEALGATDGDLAGGELAADQLSSPWPEHPFPRSPLKGLYLAGSRLAMFSTCAAGAAAAKTVAADLAAGRLK